MKFLQKLGKSLMLPVACLPICGILMGLGYWMCPATMQGGEINGIIQQIGFYLVKAGGALIDNMAILFAIGIGVGMADDNDGTAALSALASWCIAVCMAGYLRSTGCTWRSNRKPGCCWSWYLCILQQTAHPIRSAPCTEQRILVRYDRPWRSDTLLGRRDISRCYMEPWYVHVRILPMYDVRYSWCCACYGTYSKTC